MNWKRSGLSVSIILLCASLSAAHAQSPSCEPDKVGEKYPDYAGKVVKIAVSPTQPPYAYSDPNDLDRMTGLEVELIENTMRCAGLKFEYIKGAWGGLLQSMFSGASDVMAGNVSYRADRAEKVDYILYQRAGSAVVVRKGNPKGIVDLVSLCGTTGSGTAGGSSQFYLERQAKVCVDAGRPPITFVPSVDAERAYRLVPVGRVDFAIDDAGSAMLRIGREPEMQLGFIATSDLVNGMVVTEGNATMLRIVTDGLKVQERDGTLAILMQKYRLPTDLLIPVEARP